MSSTSPMHLLVSLVVFLASVPLCNGSSSKSTFPNTTNIIGSSTTIQGVVWIIQPVTITIAANVTEVETFYPGGGALNAHHLHSDWAQRRSLPLTLMASMSTTPSGTTKTESLLSSVDTGHLTGDCRSGGYPWEVDTTFLLTGPTVYVTQGVTVGPIKEDSPPYALQSSSATSLDVTTTATTAAATVAPSPIDTAAVFNPQPASSSPATRQPISTSTPNPASALMSQENESSSSAVSAGATSKQSPATTATLLPVSGNEAFTLPLSIAGLPASVLNVSALISGSRNLTPDSPAIIIASIRISLNSAAIIAGSSTVPFPTHPVPPLSPPVLTVGTEPITLFPSAVAIAGTTLRPGATGLTIDGTLVSLDATALVVGTETEVFLSPTQTMSAGLAPLIFSGLGQTGASSGASATTNRVSGPSSAPFAGRAQRIDRLTGWWSWTAGLLVGLGLCC
ncbi:Muc22p [Xylographa pallens]|nr:Muc22p [Xylographa pallens]